MLFYSPGKAYVGCNRNKERYQSFWQKHCRPQFDLKVPQGALYGVIGPNGAGKATMIRMILSILFPDSGELTVLGGFSALQAKDRIGYLPEERGLYNFAVDIGAHQRQQLVSYYY